MHYVEQLWKITATKESPGPEWVPSSPFRTIRNKLIRTMQYEGWQWSERLRWDKRIRCDYAVAERELVRMNLWVADGKHQRAQIATSATSSAIQCLWPMPIIPHASLAHEKCTPTSAIWFSLSLHHIAEIDGCNCCFVTALTIPLVNVGENKIAEMDIFFFVIRTKYISYYAIVDMRANNRTEVELKQKAPIIFQSNMKTDQSLFNRY